MAINTLYHLEAQQHDDPSVLAGADHFLTIADYFNARLSGVEAVEQSLASTTQLYNPQTRDWSGKLIAALGLSRSLFPKIVPSGTVLGPVTDELRRQPALAQAQVIATCSHDTGAAVAAVPAREGNWAYLSSGTWSLLGAELAAPILTDAAREAGFTNEVGFGGTIRFLKNIAGLWVLQECRRAWEAAGQGLHLRGAHAARRGRRAGRRAHLARRPALSFHRRHAGKDRRLLPRDRPARCPTTTGQFVRTILESLALTYARTLRQLEEIVGRKFETAPHRRRRQPEHACSTS